MDVEVIDRDGTVIAVLSDAATEVHPRAPVSMVEDLFRARDDLEAALDAGLVELLGPMKGK